MNSSKETPKDENNTSWISEKKRAAYLSHFDEWALPIISDEVKNYQYVHQTRYPSTELENVAFVFYRKRFRELKKIDEGLLRHITKFSIFTFVVTNDRILKIPGGTLTKKGATKKIRMILAPLNQNELFYEKESLMAKDLALDLERTVTCLPHNHKVVLLSYLLGNDKKITLSLLKDKGVSNPREVLKQAEANIIREFVKCGYFPRSLLPQEGSHPS